MIRSTLQYQKPLSSSNNKPNTAAVPVASTPSLSKVQLLPSTSSVAITTSSESHEPIPLFTAAPFTSSSLNFVALSSSNHFPLLHAPCFQP
ncbi:hypothetical protein TNCV_3966381 [Trichonephila clavipes]|nr:hypothetical protein TNCV_3966381 [Trichonephila clavipes]